SLTGLLSSGRIVDHRRHPAGPASVTAAVRTAVIRTVISSRAFVEKADLADIVAAVEKGGAKLLWLEDVRESVTALDKLAAALLWRWPLQRQDAAKPAVILFTSGSEGTPKAVVLSHKNLYANAMQAEARITISPADILLNVLPVFHSFGLTGGTILPLVTGVKLFLYPSPLHYKIIPEVARKVKPTIMFGTDTFLANYARTAKDGDFSSLRFVVAGAEAVKPETRRVYRERFQAEIIEGFGLTEAAPVVAVNTAIHGRDGTVGRLLPAMRMKLEPVEGISDAGQLWLDGPNLMMGYMTSDRP
ncbi:2-acyl-glycerophospho-ethanolamine acyltransferase, partial [Mesorhizobium sp. M7A.T.Ca.TU.009.01.3.1]